MLNFSVLLDLLICRSGFLFRFWAYSCSCLWAANFAFILRSKRFWEQGRCRWNNDDRNAWRFILSAFGMDSSNGKSLFLVFDVSDLDHSHSENEQMGSEDRLWKVPEEINQIFSSNHFNGPSYYSNNLAGPYNNNFWNYGSSRFSDGYSSNFKPYNHGQYSR